MIRSRSNCRRIFHGGAGRALLMMSLFLLITNCTQPDDNGNDNGNQNDNANVNDNGNDNANTNGDGTIPPSTPGLGQILVEFDFSTGNNVIAQALEGDGTEYGFFGDKDASGAAFQMTRIDVILTSTVAVRTTLDESQRPSQLLAEDRSAMLLSYDDAGTEVTAVFVATNGETTRTTITLDNSSARSPAQALFGITELCEVLDGIGSITDRILSTCESDPNARLCTSSIAQSIEALDSFCSAELFAVTNRLSPSIGQGPALTVPLAVVITASSHSITPNAVLSLRGEVLGGEPPYLFDWEALQGSPSQPDIGSVDLGTISIANLTLVFEGTYTFRLTVFGGDGESSFFEVVIVVSEDPGALVVEAQAEVFPSDPFTVNLSAEARGGLEPFAFMWSLDAGEGEVTFGDETAAATSAIFSQCGIFILKVTATDVLGVTTGFDLPIMIINTTTDLIVEIDPPACTEGTFLDACVALGANITLGVDTTNESSPGALEYAWEIIDGVDSAFLSDETTANAILHAIGPETVVVEVTVTDSETCQSTTDQISVEVIQSGQLAVDIFSDGNATLGHPETLHAQVTGAIGLLSFEWEVIDGDGTFTINEDAPQNVLFTPMSRPTVTVQVTVTDDARNPCTANDDCAGDEVCTVGQCAAIATEELEIATFAVSIVGDTTIPSNSLATYSITLSGDAPSGVFQAWSIQKRDADDSLAVVVVGDTAAVLQILPEGDGVFDLLLAVTDATDEDNVAEKSIPVIVECADADRPDANAGPAQLAAVSTGSEIVTVTMSCSDPSTSDQSGRLFRWLQVSGDPVANIEDEDSRFAKFDMPQSAPLGFDPIVFECIVGNPASNCESSERVGCATDEQCASVGGTTCGQIDAGLCDGLLLSDTTVVYAEPLVVPSTALQTKLVGSLVTLACEQDSGSLADTYDWRQVDADGDEVDPQDQVADFNLDAETGVLMFTAPSSAQQLFFECQGIISSPDGDLAGPFSADDRAIVDVVNFDVSVVVQDGDDAAGGALADIDVDRIRLTNASPGEVVFTSTLIAASADSGVFSNSFSDTNETLVLEGDAAPNGGEFGQIGPFDIDAAANLAFVVPVDGAPAGGETDGVFALFGSSLVEIAADGATDENPSGNRFCGFGDVALGGSGDVTFLAQFDADGDGNCSGTVREGLYNRTGGLLSTVAQSGTTTIPDSVPGVKFGDFFEQLHANDDGDVVFAGRDSGSTAIGAFIEPSGGDLDRLFLNDRTAADTGGAYGDDLPADLAIADRPTGAPAGTSGVAAFQADLKNINPTQGLFINAEPGSVGTTIALNSTSSPEGFFLTSFQQVAINSHGDLAFIADGRLLFYAVSSGTVVEVRNADGVAVRNGSQVVTGVIINAGNGLADVQFNDDGVIVFSANVNGSSTAILQALPPG